MSRPQDFRIIKILGRDIYFDSESIALALIEKTESGEDEEAITLTVFLKGRDNPLNFDVSRYDARVFIQDWHESHDMSIYGFNEKED